MSGIHSNDDNIEKLLRQIGEENGAAEKLRQAALRNPSAAKAIAGLSDSDIEKIAALLSDKQALTRLMSSPKAKELLGKLKG